MGFRKERGIEVGPFRFTFSSGGIVVSKRASALRPTPETIGNYVRSKGSAIEYKKAAPDPPRYGRVKSPPTHDELSEIESETTARMVDSSSADLLNQLKNKWSRQPLWPFLAVLATVIVFGLTNSSLDGWIIFVVAGVAGSLVFHAYRQDQLLRTVVVLYDLDGDLMEAYENLLEQASRIGRCARVWHVEAEGGVREKRYHAGVDKLVRRKRTRVRLSTPPCLKTNVEAVKIGVGSQKLYLLPDRALLYEKSGIGSIPYRELAVRCQSVDFAEQGEPPADARIVGRTWKHVNQDGAPDRRFGQNPPLQVCRYGEIHFQSESGLNERIQISRAEAAESFVEALRNLAARSREREGARGEAVMDRTEA